MYKPAVLPYSEKKVTRLYWSIGDVAKMFDVNTSLIRFWEEKFDVLDPQKDRKGNRRYTEKDIENLRLVYHFVKERGFTIEGAINAIEDKEARNNYEEKKQLIDRLTAIKSFLVKVRDEL